jgi:hypothetical protein
VNKNGSLNRDTEEIEVIEEHEEDMDIEIKNEFDRVGGDGRHH